MQDRPEFIVSAHSVPEHAHVYPQSTEAMGPMRALGAAAGLQRIGINLQRLPPARVRPGRMQSRTKRSSSM